MPPTFREQQSKFGPYYFGYEGGGDAPGPGSAPNAGTLGTLSNSTPTTMGGFAAQGMGKGPGSGIVGKGTTMAANMALNVALNALGIPTAAITAPITGLLSLSQLAHRAGLVGQDTSGLASPQGLASMNQGVDISNASFAALAQGLGLTNAQLDAISANAPFGQPAPAPDPSFADISNSPDAGIGGGGGGPAGSGAPGGSAGSPSGGGDSGNPGDFLKGGLVKDRSRLPGGKEPITAHEEEFVVNPKASKLHRVLLGAINGGASKLELVALMKAGR